MKTIILLLLPLLFCSCMTAPSSVRHVPGNGLTGSSLRFLKDKKEGFNENTYFLVGPLINMEKNVSVTDDKYELSYSMELFGGLFISGFEEISFDKAGNETDKSQSINMLNGILLDSFHSEGSVEKGRFDLLLGVLGCSKFGEAVYPKILWFTFPHGMGDGIPVGEVTDKEQITSILKDKKSEEANTYVIFYSASDCREKDGNLNHPIDKNCGWLGTAKSYINLVNNGIPEENIFVLYKDSEPDMDDPAISEFRGKLEKEMKMDYSHFATEQNFKAVEKALESVIDENDSLWIFISTHGASNGELLTEVDDTIITPAELNAILKDNRYNPGNLVVVESCYSANVIKRLNAPATYISSVGNQIGWIDREFSYNEYFTRNLFNLENDCDNNGKVDFHEAFAGTKQEYMRDGEAKMEFINGEYLSSLPFFTMLFSWFVLDDVGFNGKIIKRTQAMKE